MMISAECYLGKSYRLLALAHKVLHTFEKMDAINPTFEPIHQQGDRVRYMIPF